MALAALLLPSSSASSASSSATKAATAGDHSGSRRHHHQGTSSNKRKKKPPPSPQPSLPPRTPPGSAGSRRAAMAGASSSSSKKVATPKNTVYQQQQRRVPSKKTAASLSSSSSSWEQLKSLLSCRNATAAARVHDPAAPSALARLRGGGAGACGASLCAMRDVVDAASSAASSAAATDRDTAPLTRRSRAHRAASASSSSVVGAGGHSSLRGLSGCYECRAINVEPMSRRYPRPRELCACSQCGEVFTKAESLEHHQAIRHAVSELGPEDSGRNIVEIIFKSSWQKRDRPMCQIDRILKVHNAPRTVARFEAYRDAVRARCVAARAAADGNELLRFHSAPLACALGINGDTSLCVVSSLSSSSSSSSSSSTTASSSSAPHAANNNNNCGVCTAIRHGFAPWVGAHPLGVRTTASSGRAHDCGASSALVNEGRRAMLVCRVIAGRVRRRRDAAAAQSHHHDDDEKEEEEEEEETSSASFDSVAGEDAASSSVYGNLEELFVANPRAILPCFVVIYRVIES
ncbi:hypothetical protein PR202_gb27388 [Eleusine coracana subsp. coracana]|uniref:C2H2-type domain-containing protein n=1 Tax=Eleusine coracana subsp. coracana TaxID=191504 RepID=A0AAV5FRP8_ELECO|nr:hypothetical protein QOZ80_4BG0359590 [Eleusine coracana subsp. coracana]GJN38354.1 hypothetical protein PR202_gb27388 [Eleusine coracana subsp. coracana]